MDLPVKYDSLSTLEKRLVRAEYTRRQDGLCHHCNKSLKGEPAKHITDKPLTMKMFPKGFLKWPVHLHHSHDTGLTIGAVHSYCNAVLFEYHYE